MREYLSTDEILKIADAVDVEALDDNDFLVVASQLVNLYGGSKDIRSGCVARDKDGYRVALFIVKGGYDRDELALEAIPYKPAYACTESSWWTAHNSGEIILDAGPWVKMGFRLNHQRVSWDERSHVTGCRIYIDKMPEDKEQAFWSRGNVQMYGQAMQLMAAARDELNVELRRRFDASLAKAASRLFDQEREAAYA